MGMTRHPHGVSSFGIPVLGGVGDLITTGNVWFVDSGSGSDSNKGTDKDHAFATLDYAIGKCTASQGDTIIVMEGHAETVTTQIAADVAGINIIGLGHGGNRPTFTINAAIWGMYVTADDVFVHNLVFKTGSSATALTSLICNRSADDNTFHKCRFEMPYDCYHLVRLGATVATHNIKLIECEFENTVTTNASAHPQNAVLIRGGSGIETDVTLDGCRFLDMEAYKTEGWDECIKVGGIGDVIVKDCIFNCRGVAVTARSAAVSPQLSLIDCRGISTSSNTAYGSIFQATYANTVETYAISAVNKKALAAGGATESG